MHDVFISYASEDGEQARSLRRALNELSLDVFIDVKALPIGEPWQYQLPKGIDESRLFAFIVPRRSEGQVPLSSEGHYCIEEIVHAINIHRGANTLHLFVPILLPGREMSSLPFGTKSLHGLELEKMGSWEAVAREIGQRLEEVDAVAVPRSLPERPEPRPTSSLSNLAIRQVVGGERGSPSTSPHRADESPWKHAALQKRLATDALAALSCGQPAPELPIVVKVADEGGSGGLMDARHLLDLDVPRMALLGKWGSGRREVLELHLEALVDAAETGTAPPGVLARLLPCVVRLDVGSDALDEQCDAEVRRFLASEDRAVDHVWPIVVDASTTADSIASSRRLDRYLRSRELRRCRHQTLVMGDEVREHLSDEWTVVSTVGVYLESLASEATRRRLEQLATWAAAEAMPRPVARLAAAREGFPAGDFALELIRHYCRQGEVEGFTEEAASHLRDRTLPSVLRRAHGTGHLALDVPRVTDLARATDFFPDGVEPKNAAALIRRIACLFAFREGAIQVRPSPLAALLTARGYGLAQEAPSLPPEPTAFDHAVVAAWPGDAQLPERDRSIVAFLRLMDGAVNARPIGVDEFRSVAGALDEAARAQLMQSELGPYLASALHVVAQTPEARELIGLVGPVTRALWAHEELTATRTPTAEEATSLLRLIEPGYMWALMSIAPARRARLIDNASAATDPYLLRSHFEDLSARRPSLFPAELMDRLSQPLPERSE